MARFTEEQYRAFLLRQKDSEKFAEIERLPDDAVTCEGDLHNNITDYCKQRGWPAFHGSMAHKAMRTLGEPDFTILASNSRVFFIECKTKDGKLSNEQRGLAMMAEMNGHKIHVVRSMDEFRKIVE